MPQETVQEFRGTLKECLEHISTVHKVREVHITWTGEDISFTEAMRQVEADGTANSPAYVTYPGQNWVSPLPRQHWWERKQNLRVIFPGQIWQGTYEGNARARFSFIKK